MHCKVEKKEVDPMSISPDTLSSDELCSVDIAAQKPLHNKTVIVLSSIKQHLPIHLYLSSIYIYLSIYIHLLQRAT